MSYLPPLLIPGNSPAVFSLSDHLHQVGALSDSPGSYVTPGQSAMGGTTAQKTAVSHLALESVLQFDGLLIDWLTLRVRIESCSLTIQDRIHACLGRVTCTDPDGVVKWQKQQLDIDKLRSDSQGLYWSAQSDGIDEFLVIAGSPASMRSKVNVFGDLDIKSGADLLRRAAMKALLAYLPEVEFWQCRRIDITGNYVLPDGGSVRQALRQLLNTDGVRRKASSNKRGGDTVYWNPTSDLTKGKAYHKGPQLAVLLRKGKIGESDITTEQMCLADRLLRLEHTRGSRWFRRFEQAGGKWWQLNAVALQHLYRDFFGPLTGGLEVKDMGREQIVRQIEVASHVTQQQALQAFATYRNIKADGFEETKSSMARRTWCRHLKILRIAGFSDAQLCAGNVVPFQAVRVLLARPVTSWADIRMAA